MIGQSVQSSTERALVLDVQRRVPASQRAVQEAFTTEHRRPVLVRLPDLRTDTFYHFDEITACAFGDAIAEFAARYGNGRLTLSYSVYGEFQAQQHRLQRIASKVKQLRILTVGAPNRVTTDSSFGVFNTTGTVLAGYRIAIKEGTPSVLFVCRDGASKSGDRQRSLGFFTCDSETVDELADDVELLLRGLTTRFATFERLQLLHETTQRVARELENYSQRMELAIRRAHRRPDLLTPARFNRIVGQAIAKMEQLKEIPRRALRTLAQRQDR